MALKPLNSVGGFSVGEIPANVILANADIIANNATFSGNVRISNATASWGVLTDNLYYSNGSPWDFQQAAGSNGEIQFNMGDDFSASPNLTFDTANANFKVIGNANITGTLTVGGLEVDEIFNGNSNVAIPVANSNVNISVAGNANIVTVTGTGANVNGYLDVSGNATAANLNLDNGYIESLGTSGLYLTPANATVGIVLQSNTAPNANNVFNLGSSSKVWANIYGNNVTVVANLDSGNANLGNLATANYVNVANNINVTGNINTGNLQVNVTANISNVNIANFVTSNLTPSIDNNYSLGTTSNRWKDINIAGNANLGVVNATGNGTFANVEFGNLLTGNYALFDNDVQVTGNIANANNISATNYVYANNANITANLTSGNANLGNLAQANFVNVSQNLNVNGNIAGTYANLVGNLHIAPSGSNNFGILTDYLYYANGTAWDLQEAAGSNNEIQYNLNDNFAASANFTYNDTTQVFKVTGNANITNTLLTPNVNSGTANLTLTANGFNTVIDNTGNATFPGNVTAHTFYGNVNANVTISAANTQVLFSDAGAIAGANGFVFDKTSNLVTMSGNVNLGLASVNQLVNLTNTALEIRGGWDSNAGAVNIVAGDYDNNATWGKLAILGNYSGNAVGFSEANAFVFTNPGYGAGNVVRVDILNTAAANTTSGALQVAGGLGVTGNGYFGNLSVTGDIANANNIFATNYVNANNATFTANLTSGNANLGNLAQANYVNVSSNVTSNNVTVNLELSGNTANFSGNVQVNNFDVNLELSGNTANFSGNVILPNLTVNLELAGNTANFTGNVSFANANLGNVATANYVNVSSNVTSNNVTVNLELSGNTANFSGNVITNNLTVNLELAGNTANFIGNVTFAGPNVIVNNNIDGNTANFTGNISSLNANLGNLADANFIRTGELLNGNSNIVITANGNILFSVEGLANVHKFSNVGVNVVGYVEANGNGTFGAVYSNSVTAQAANLELYSYQVGNTNILLHPHGTGTVDVNNTRITSLAEPNASSDAATKYYVDTVVQGLDVKDSVHAASYAAIANAYTYNNGTGGVGATLTANQNGTLVLDGQTILLGERVLIKNETGAYVNNTTPSAAFNGIYECTTEGTAGAAWVLTRTADFDTAAEMYGAFTFIETGSNQADTGWVCTNNVANPITVGTTQILWSQFSGAGTYQAGSGLTLTGTTFSVNVDNVTTEINTGNVIVKANAQLTTPNIGAATGTSLDLTGNLLAANVNSNAKITAANIEVVSNVIANYFNANSNITANNATINLALAGNTANFSGNVILPNLTVNLELAGNTANFTGNIKSLNANLGNLATANYINVANLITTVDANVTGTLTAANANFGGNITVNNLTVNLELSGNTANFSGNVILPNLTVNTTLSGNVGNFTGNITGANANLGNLITANYANISSNVVTSNLTVNLAVVGNTANFSGNVESNNLDVNLEFSGNTANFSGNVILPNLTVNLELAGNTANFTGNIVVNNLLANGVANVGNLYVQANVTSALVPNGNLTLDLGSSSQRWQDIFAGNLDASGNIATLGNISANNITSNTFTANNSVDVGNTAIYWAEVTTSSTGANQTLSTVSITGVTGVEWIVKATDATGSKYSMSIVTAVTDGTSADYAQFGGVNLGSTTGILAVNVVGSNIALQVTPSSSNSTQWVTQYRTI